MAAHRSAPPVADAPASVAVPATVRTLHSGIQHPSGLFAVDVILVGGLLAVRLRTS